MPITTTQPSLVLNWGIMLQGIYPSRDGGDGSFGIGHLRLFGFNFDPRGMADTNGAIIPIQQNTALFSLLGTNYGGDGRTNFALPNLDSRVAVSDGFSPGLGFYTIGQVSGADAVGLAQVNLPVSRGGSGAAVSQVEESLTIRYSINVEGIYPSQGGSGSIGAGLIGQIHAFAGNFSPNGSMTCEGQLLQISDYTALFTVIGTTYGGDGVTTFALPDLRGRTPVGTGSAPGLPTITIGQAFGAETVALAPANLPVEMGGSAAPISNYGPSLGITFAIATGGIFPSRNQEVFKDGDAADGPVSTEAGEPPYVGEIIMFAGNFPPSGYQVANGQLLSIAQNQALFALLGTQFGGDGVTTFALPDLRGRAAVDESAGQPVGTQFGSSGSIIPIGEIPALALNGTGGNDSYFGGNQSDILNGNAGNDTLTGNGGNDLINGGLGADAMNGGAGDDTFTVDDAGDTVIGGIGTDLVRASIASFSLGADVENLAFIGTGNFTGLGNATNNVITGGDGNDRLKGREGDDTLNGGLGNDILNGGTGIDILNGGDGNDTLIIDNGGDIANGGAGTDTVQVVAAGTYSIAADVEVVEALIGGTTITLNALDNVYGGSTGDNVANGGDGNDTMIARGGNDTLSGGNGNDRLDAAAGNDTLNGDAGNDVLEGGAGTDTLNGGANDDTLFGGDDNDVLAGGAGSDLLFGGGGADRFVFASGDAPIVGETDRIFDFSSAAGDRIDLSAIDAVAGGSDNAFAFIGTNAFTGVAGQLRYDVVGGVAFVTGDTNGDGIADFVIRVDGTPVLTGTDFIL